MLKESGTPCGAPLGELGISRRYSSTNWIAYLVRRCHLRLTCVILLRACGALLVIFIMAEYAAEIEVWSDSEEEREEVTNYDEVQDYLANSTYPERATKAVKGVIRKSANKFQLLDGV